MQTEPRIHQANASNTYNARTETLLPEWPWGFSALDKLRKKFILLKMRTLIWPIQCSINYALRYKALQYFSFLRNKNRLLFYSTLEASLQTQLYIMNKLWIIMCDDIVCTFALSHRDFWKEIMSVKIKKFEQSSHIKIRRKMLTN